MIKQDYVLLIMNCKKYSDKAEIQRQTWLPKIPNYLKFYHVIGEEDLNEKFKFDDENMRLYVKTPDDYNSLPKKL